MVHLGWIHLSISVDLVRRESMEHQLKEQSTMQFLMFVCRDTVPVEPPPEPAGDIEEWVSTMAGRGLRVTGDRLAPEREASAVRVRNGEVIVTDGPFLETKEVLGGFDLLECRDLAEAIEVAAAHPYATQGVLEIRPIWTG
jgi:hypothetical protein